MRVFQVVIFITLFLLIILGSWTDSLWTPDFQGYLSGGATLQEGDIVFVEVDMTSTLSFSSSSTDSKSITLDFSGGEFGDLFSFLPVVKSSGAQTVKGKEECTLKSVIGTRVVEIDSSKKVFLRGTRGISIEGKEESLTLTGWVDPQQLGPERKVSFSQLADVQLRFRTFLQPAANTLTDRDIEEIIRAVRELPAGEAAEEEVQLEAPAPEETSALSYKLTESKKKELLLRYINRLIDLIFK